MVTHLRTLLTGRWQATLLAVDGATTSGIPGQLERMPADATHVALSVGGNDALGNIDLLSTAVTSTGEALDLFHSRTAGFESAYRRALGAVRRLALPTIVCTIYNGALPDPAEARRAATALRLFNDVIVRAALESGCALLELRHICFRAADYANPIEPSDRGGGKIARALARAVGAVEEPEPALYTPDLRRV